jgi:hypothetical protein
VPLAREVDFSDFFVCEIKPQAEWPAKDLVAAHPRQDTRTIFLQIGYLQRELNREQSKHQGSVDLQAPEAHHRE